MDKQARATDLIKHLYQYRNNEELDSGSFILELCRYNNCLSKEDSTMGQLAFLQMLATEVGIPQYFDLYCKMHEIKAKSDYFLDDLSQAVANSSLCTDENVCLHRYQKFVLDKFKADKENRFFLTAATSFGKTFLVYEIIRKLKYTNILLIFPTIALLSENLYKIFRHDTYKWISEKYTVHTISDINQWSDTGNILILTPERYLSFVDKNPNIKFDFLFVDEVYKLDNEYIQDGEVQENDRDIAYRIALYYALQFSRDCLLAGPYLNIGSDDQQSLRSFLNNYNIKFLKLNQYEIVAKDEYNIASKKMIVFDETKFKFYTSGKVARVCELAHKLSENNENSIVYCSTKASAENYAKSMIEILPNNDDICNKYQSFISHLDALFNGKGRQWVVTKALKKGVGIHHGLVPKYIQNEIIRMFNKGDLKILFATTTITEGVNTNAKNIIVLSGKKGTKRLKKFDALNIEGRAGRFLQHFCGRVFIFDNEFKKVLESEDEILRHKLFDKEIDKGPVEVEFTGKEYLTDADTSQLNANNAIKESLNLPRNLYCVFKTFSVEDKAFLYSSICRLTEDELKAIELFIQTYNHKRTCKQAGLDIICNAIKRIVDKKSALFNLLNKTEPDRKYCILTYMLPNYLNNNFSESVNYYIKEGEEVDVAVRKVGKLMYTVMKYEAVKYFGLFNVAYKCFLAQKNSLNYDDVKGMDILLHKLEFQAETRLGRLASDAGATPNVINYYDSIENENIDSYKIYRELDDFEKQNITSIKDIVEREINM
jgi:hypothetical protein